MSLLITAGIVATGLGAFIAGVVVAALGGLVILRGTRERRAPVRALDPSS